MVHTYIMVRGFIWKYNNLSMYRILRVCGIRENNGHIKNYELPYLKRTDSNFSVLFLIIIK